MTNSPDPTPSTRANRLAAAFGVFSIVVALGAITVAILLSTRFTFSTSALSDLGRASWASTAVFNYGLLFSGVLALPFAVVLAKNARTLLHAAGSLAFALAAVSLSLIGVFALPAPEHGLVAVGFFLAFTVAFVFDGVGDVRTGTRARGLATLALALVHVLGWAVWFGAGTPGGLALPELVGSACLSVWVLATAARLW
ncbi:DUF998 domain-containing protein [Halococcus qingdaonensis]|uniref:DUF998 domain-containing protein n=1 Tax=Halococcus qingdaonensis TaxID=224402 RepID=UPI002116A183|nr:DUF998 domain-containing protein [Halococcus qingdaonensis]